MRPLPLALALVAVSAVAVGGLSGCLTGQKSFDDESTHDEKITAVRIDLEAGGGVTLRGSKDNTKVKVERSVSHHGDRPDRASHRIKDGVLVLGGCGHDCSVTYRVDLPAGIPVNGKTAHGSLDFTRVGAVKVSTSSGSVTMNRVSGAVEARTSHGSIKGRALSGGGVTARSSSGDIDLVATAVQDVDASTANGDVRITVPKSEYTLEAKTANGEREVDVTDTPSAKHGLRAVSSNGDITIRTS